MSDKAPKKSGSWVKPRFDPDQVEHPPDPDSGVQPGRRPGDPAESTEPEVPSKTPGVDGPAPPARD